MLFRSATHRPACAGYPAPAPWCPAAAAAAPSRRRPAPRWGWVACWPGLAGGGAPPRAPRPGREGEPPPARRAASREASPPGEGIRQPWARRSCAALLKEARREGGGGLSTQKNEEAAVAAHTLSESLPTRLSPAEEPTHGRRRASHAAARRRARGRGLGVSRRRVQRAGLGQDPQFPSRRHGSLRRRSRRPSRQAFDAGYSANETKARATRRAPGGATPGSSSVGPHRDGPARSPPGRGIAAAGAGAGGGAPPASIDWLGP